MVIGSIVIAGPEGIVPVIIVLVVIGKIIKAIKEASSQTPRTPSPSAPPARKQRLEQDLEKFFQKLADPATQAPAPPPPVPAAARPARRAVPVAQDSPPPPPQAARRVQAAQAPKAKPKWGTEHYGVDRSAHQRANCAYTAKKSRQEIISMIKDDESIRKAILLREILGPPVSLRGDPAARA